MTADFRALEWAIIVLHALEDFFFDFAITSQGHAVDVLNVTSAAAARH